jgi:hypothetical protein
MGKKKYPSSFGNLVRKPNGKRQRGKRRRVLWESNIKETGCEVPGTAELAQWRVVVVTVLDIYCLLGMNLEIIITFSFCIIGTTTHRETIIYLLLTTQPFYIISNVFLLKEPSSWHT